MNKKAYVFLAATVFLTAGWKSDEVKPVSWKKQTAYLSSVQDPRRYGYSIYETPAGIEYRGGCRLHANQGGKFSMKADEPLRPVIALRRSYGFQSPVLLDFCSAASWMEFDLAQTLGAKPVGETKPPVIKCPGDEIAGCLSVIPTIRLDQIYIENPLVYVRMAAGPLGLLARGIDDPSPKGVLGWDLLKKFDQIHLDYAEERVALFTPSPRPSPYMCDPAMLIARVPLVKHAAACSVRGAVDGKESLILIDPAGDFEVATDGAAAVTSVQLDADLLFSAPEVTKSVGGTRIGARLLRKFKITVCPQDGAIYFEKPESGKAE